MGQELVLEQPSRKVGAFEKRVHEVDFIRGVLILLVIFDHIMNNFLLNTSQWYDITHNQAWLDAYHFFQWYWECVPRQLIRQICLVSFCFISGISCAFSRNNWKRAGEMILVFALLQVGSNLLSAWKWLGNTSVIIDFNVIGVLAFSTLFYCFVQKQSWKGLLASTLIWFLFVTYGMAVINTIPGTANARVPSLIKPINMSRVADWMPIAPYIFFFFAGALLSYFVYADRKPKFKRHGWERPVCFIGRYTLWIYLGHQVVFIPIFMIVTEILRATHGG